MSYTSVSILRWADARPEIIEGNQLGRQDTVYEHTTMLRFASYIIYWIEESFCDLRFVLWKWFRLAIDDRD